MHIKKHHKTNVKPQCLTKSEQVNPKKFRHSCNNNRGTFFPQVTNLIISGTCLKSRAIIFIFMSKMR